LAKAFALLWGSVMVGALITLKVCASVGERCQGERTKPPKLRQEILDTTRAMWVAATFAAWPMAQAAAGETTGLKWTSAEAGYGWPVLIAQILAGIIVMDAWLYWKHRILHTRTFFVFHKHHHAFKDPTPFAGFAIHPVEAIVTFWPILLLIIPEAVHFAPLYFTAVVGFISLNLYLHCGVTFNWAEAILPKFGLNSSAFHNKHHSRANVNFGEASFVRDIICKTRFQDFETRRAKGTS
jgi:lathosterol oxidase